jgi:predicted membrane protein
LGSVFFAWQARHEYSLFLLIRLIISYNLLMYLLKFFTLKTYKTVYHVSNMAVFWIDMSAIIYAWNFTITGIIKYYMVLYKQKCIRKVRERICVPMDQSPINQNFELNKSRQNFITAWNSITKLVIFQSLVAKCCKMRICG